MAGPPVSSGAGMPHVGCRPAGRVPGRVPGVGLRLTAARVPDRVPGVGPRLD